MGQRETFSIRQMVELTGLSEFTIRGWENRYAAFRPRRGGTGRREYRRSDVERAILLRALLKRGHKIGHVARLSNQRLQSLIAEMPKAAQAKAGDRRGADVVPQVFELMALEKWAELKSLIDGVPSNNASRMVQEFFLPVLGALANNVQAGIASIGQEHVLSSLLKEKIYAALNELEGKRRRRASQTNARFVLATPEGDYHEFGLLMAHLVIRDFGFTSLYLGPHTPARDLSETALRFNASHLLVVSTVSKRQGARQEFLSYLSSVQTKIGAQTQILVAGSQVPPISSDVEPAIIRVATFPDLEGYLLSLGGQAQ